MHEVQELIAQNETAKAIEALKTLLQQAGRPDLMKTVINQSAAFFQAREFHANNLLDFKEFRQEQSKINYALLTVLEQLNQKPEPKTGEHGEQQPQVRIENSKNVVVGTGNINTQGGDFIVGDR